ncbi:hypothetical protein CMO83_05055 [Candidatus Woesearchaeota archaeon]|nr:hypothetical protein [Candidatus Woesearchaeota archaeon]
MTYSIAHVVDSTYQRMNNTPYMLRFGSLHRQHAREFIDALEELFSRAPYEMGGKYTHKQLIIMREEALAIIDGSSAPPRGHILRD